MLRVSQLGVRMDGVRQQSPAYTIDVQRRGVEAWQSQRLSPDWVYGRQSADAAVQALDLYLEQHQETVTSLVSPQSQELRVLVTPQRSGTRPAVFTLRSVLEHRVRREVGRRLEAQRRLDRATEALRTSVRDAAAAGIRQSELARMSGWSRETLRKMNRDA
jgi:DNA-binding XRE family transcriptional regulator